MGRTFVYIVCGYLSGSILFARLWTHLRGGEVALLSTKDSNPGVANAFACGGFTSGVLTLLGDLLKGFLPVFCFTQFAILTPQPLELALVLAAPVLGHAFSLFYGGQGGKGITVSFGCLLGLLPHAGALAILAASFIFFSTVVKITPNFYRTAVTYLTASLIMMAAHFTDGSTLGFLLMTLIVCLRLHLSPETREEWKVEFPWRS